MKVVKEWERKAKAGGVSRLMARLKVELPEASSQSLNMRLAQYNASKMSRQKR